MDRYFLIEDKYVFDCVTGYNTMIEDIREWAIPTYKLIDDKIYKSGCGDEGCCPFELVNASAVKIIEEEDYIKLSGGKK